jgi:phosphohistidine phosphatase
VATEAIQMHQLLLLRHANSSRDDPELADHARPLSAKGKRAAATMRQAMRDLGLQPDIVLVSSSRRTMETLEALEPWDETPLVEPLDALYMASAKQMLKILRTLSETARSVMVIGHNPGMHELALGLVGGREAVRDTPHAGRLVADGFPTAAVAEFALPGSWHALAPGGARLVRFLAPRDLPEAAG